MEEMMAPKKHIGKRWLFIGTLLLIPGLVLAGSLIWRMQQPKSLLPASVAQKITNFTPYFYFDKIPAGYSLDTANISLSGNILMIPLTRTGDSSVILTEQILSEDIDKEALQKNGQIVSGGVGPATINNVEGRLVGTMFIAGHKTLVLLSATSSTDKSDLMDLLRGLKPLH